MEFGHQTSRRPRIDVACLIRRAINQVQRGDFTVAEQFTDDQRNRVDIVEDLARLTEQDGFLYTFCSLVVENLWLSPDEVADVDWHSRLNSGELAFLLGLLVKHPIQLTLPHSPEMVQFQMETATRLLSELHSSYIPSAPNPSDAGSSSENLSMTMDQIGQWLDSGERFSEAAFYSGPGAFDFQFLELASRKYARDAMWIQNHLGTSLESIIDVSAKLKDLFNTRFQSLPAPQTFEDHCRQVLAILSFTTKDLDASAESISALIQHFSLVPGTVNQGFDTLGAYNKALSHPIVRLDNETYLLPIPADLCGAIYENPFYWILKDPEYKDAGLGNRGEATEEIASEILEGVFGKGNVHRGVKVRKGNRDITDIDVLAFAGNKAIILQAKSKKMTALAKRGDLASVRRDFREAVQEAYDQGLVSMTTLVETGVTLEDVQGQPLQIDEDINDAYIVCLTGDYYPAVMSQLGTYLSKSSEDPYPVAVSIFDLEILCFYLDDPFELLYYLRQRSTHSDHFQAGSEMDLLAFHLRHRLHPPGNSDRTHVPSDYGQLFDAHYPTVKGDHSIADVNDRLYHHWRNDEFNQLIEDVKGIPNPTRTDIIFFLFDLAGSGADGLFELIGSVKQSTIHDGKPHNMSMLMTSGDSGITFMGFSDTSALNGDRLQLVAQARKYKSRANEWLGLGWSSASDRLVDMIWYGNEPWQKDPELERLAQQSLKQGTMIRAKGRKVGRNEPCPCGSGIKYKRCHGR